VTSEDQSMRTVVDFPLAGISAFTALSLLQCVDTFGSVTGNASGR